MPSADRSHANAVAMWAQGQGFGDEGSATLRKVLETRTWVRGLAGADPYFALFARGITPGRKKIDAAVRKGQVRIVPAVRGCMYLVSTKHVDLALNLSRQQQGRRLERDLEKVKAPKGCMARIQKSLLKALRDGALTTAELRKRCDKAVVSFGELGKKVGLSSSLPPALRLLEWEGAVERTPAEGALDSETYGWSLREMPLQDIDASAAATQIAALFFSHHGPASLEAFATWSGLTKGAAKAAVLSAGLESASFENVHGDPELLIGNAKQLRAGAKLKRCKGVRVLGLQDLYLAARGGPGCVTPASAHALEIPRWGASKRGSIGASKHPHLRSVVVDGQLVGFWEVDARMQAQHIAWIAKVSAADKKRAEGRVAALRSFMRDELGHAKIFSIDSDKKIDARFELVRALV